MSGPDRDDRDREPTWWSDALLLWLVGLLLVALVLSAATCALGASS